MNALLVSALWGVIMMFSGIAIKRAATIRTIALIGIAILLGLNLAELQGWQLVSIDTTGMLQFETYSLLFNTIILAAVLCYVMISGSAMEKIGNNLSDYLSLPVKM